MPAWSMSATRATGSYAPGRISPNETGSGENSSLVFPAATDRPEVGTRLPSYSHTAPCSVSTICGPASRYLAGRRPAQTPGGSIT